MNNDMFKSGNKIPMNISKTPMVETMYVKDDHPPPPCPSKINSNGKFQNVNIRPGISLLTADVENRE